MRKAIAITEMGDALSSIPRSGDSTAPSLSEARCTLRFRLSVDADSLEALRYARRAMLREEWTRGVDEGEPSLEEAVFSTVEVEWSVAEGDRERCREKLAELVERANRALDELEGRRLS